MQSTQPLLLVRLGDREDRAAWHEFCHRYGELIRSFARHANLQPADCDDVLQDVLMGLTKAMPGFRYDKSKGKFRSYLKTVALHAIFARMRAKKQELAIDDVKSSTPGLALSTEAIERLWDLQWRQYHLRQAMRQIEAEFNEADRTAFNQYAVNGLGAAETAQALNMSVEQVYQAKSRILKRLEFLIARQINTEG